jgi:hypothetical protein
MFAERHTKSILSDETLENQNPISREHSHVMGHNPVITEEIYSPSRTDHTKNTIEDEENKLAEATLGVSENEIGTRETI